MKTSEKGIELIKRHEHYTHTAYRGAGDVWRIGYNHTRNVRAGDQITEEAAHDLLVADLKPVEDVVKTLVTSELKQHQFDALVSFAYSEGIQVFRKSILLKLVNKDANHPMIFAEFRRFIQRYNMSLLTLVKRREAEIRMYEGRY